MLATPRPALGNSIADGGIDDTATIGSSFYRSAPVVLTGGRLTAASTIRRQGD